MTSVTPWVDANQRWLHASVLVVAHDLETKLFEAEHDEARQARRAELEQAVDQIEAGMDAPPALAVVAATFGLSRFERQLLLLCAATEIDGGVASMCAELQGRDDHYNPTLSLALAVLPDPHWSALASVAPLRRWRFVHVGDQPSLTLAPVRIDQRVLHYLTGYDMVDEQLDGVLVPRPTFLVPSHEKIAARVATAWAEGGGTDAPPILALRGDHALDKRAIAAEAAARHGLRLYVIPGERVPTDAADLDARIRLWERETVLGSVALMLEVDEVDTGDEPRMRALRHAVDDLAGPLVVSERIDAGPVRHHRRAIRFTVHKPTTDEQRALWLDALDGEDGEDGVATTIDGLIGQFDLSFHDVAMAAAEALDPAAAGTGDLAGRLSAACRARARTGVLGLAHSVDPQAGWDDLVLPDATKGLLRDLERAVRYRATVYSDWGFAERLSRGLGLGALFAGPPGTGKTLAAEVLAAELDLDLYVIDLSSLVDKYIGETEKNLRRVFDAAESSGAILLFDEADAVFGKRTEVKDSHDRYANIEVSYLLTKMESYRGLAILTTNRKDVLDPAFMRRLRFIVKFPYPDAAMREKIWERAFPSQTPVADDVQAAKLAELDATGATIRNIALNAAFLAAEHGEPVSMTHLLHAARAEYAKTDRIMAAGVGADWA